MCYICISDLSFLLLTREKWIAQVAWQVCTFITHVDNGFVSVLGFPLMTRVTWMTVSQLTATYCFYGYTAEKLPANSLSVIPIKNHKGPTNIWRSYFSHIGIRWKIQSQKSSLLSLLLNIIKHLCVVAKLSLFFPFYFPLPRYPLPLNLASTKNVHCSALVYLEPFLCAYEMLATLSSLCLVTNLLKKTYRSDAVTN